MSDCTLTDEQRKSRKPHKCDLCGESIPKGTEYVYVTYVYDGHIYEEHRHIHCDAVMDEAFVKYGAESYDECFYSIWECICEQMCTFEKRKECDLTTPLSCEICQERLLPPQILEAARQSVRNCEAANNKQP